MAKSKSASKIILKFTGTLLQLFLNIILYTVITLLVIKGGKFTFTFAYQVFGSVRMENPVVTSGTSVEVEILEEESTFNLASKLELVKLIPDKYSFYMKTKLKEYSIIPGIYVLNTTMDYDDILEVITDISNSTEAEESGGSSSP